ncbi:cupin domain-containing protein [Marinobacter sp.]|uniref:cupin domain-containing protein n=1 Tax=Marinobacter sp. TaxID=50741 RepID=UPI00384DFC03
MLINADFTRPAMVGPDEYEWVASPQAGVERVMLHRVGEEKARATSIVRYAPNSFFPRHQHPEGEEIFVMSGTFSDEEGDYPAGWYVRNPPGSSHKPSSQDGATIFVKLRQMTAEESHPVRIDTRDPSSWQFVDGQEVCPLYSSDKEQVCLQRVAPGASLAGDLAAGAELLVIDGTVVAYGQSYSRGGWIRLPPGTYPGIVAGAEGATFYLKTGHLAHAVPEK